MACADRRCGWASMFSEPSEHRGVDLVLDVGANRGQYGAQLRESGYSGRICSFEPVPAAYDAVARRATREPGWETRQLALGATDGTIAINVAGNKGASSSVLPMLQRHRDASPQSDYVDVIEGPMRRLDSIWSEVVPPGSTPFLKLDVQGFEGAVLDGGASSLEVVIGIQLEVSLVPLYEGAMSLRESLDRMEALDMRLVLVEAGFADPHTHELLQMDVVFMRSHPAASG